MKTLFFIFLLSITFSSFAQNSESADQIIIPQLKGMVLMDSAVSLSDKEIQMAIGSIDIINVQIPGKRKKLTSFLSKTFLNRPLTRQDIFKIKTAIIFHYRRCGRLLVSVKVPEQKITDGVLQFIIIEGKLGQIKIEGNKYFKTKTLSHFFRLKAGEPIDSNILIADIDWINSNPFRQVDAIYTPGDRAETTNIRILTSDRRPWRICTKIDNTGYDETDNIRILLGSHWGNLFGLDHLLSAQFVCAPHINRFWALASHYTIPLSWRDIWTFNCSYSQVHPVLKQKDLSNTGYSIQVSTRYQLMIKSFLGYLHHLLGGVDYKRMNNNIIFGGSTIYQTSINLTQLVLGYSSSYDSTHLKGCFTFELFCSPGGWLPNQSHAAYHRMRSHSDVRYLYGRFLLAPIIKMPKNSAVAFKLLGQASTCNLIASEQFGLGGHDTVRGYKERRVNVDNALLFSVEVRSTPIYLTKPYSGLLQLLFFIDYGMGSNVRNSKASPQEKKGYHLASCGPGIRYDITPYFNMRGDWGFQLRHLDKKHKCVLHFGISGSY